MLRIIRYSIKNIKNIAAQQWIIKPQDSPKKFSMDQISHLNVQHYRDIKKQFSNQIPKQQLKPFVPRMGYYEVQNPKISNKVYRWCSCGMSQKQPFCDGHHKGTKFLPYKFTIQQKVNKVKLCGCKATTNKPFCDGKACLLDKSKIVYNQKEQDSYKNAEPENQKRKMLKQLKQTIKKLP